jgi:hypothetical protein
MALQDVKLGYVKPHTISIMGIVKLQRFYMDGIIRSFTLFLIP